MIFLMLLLMEFEMKYTTGPWHYNAEDNMIDKKGHRGALVDIIPRSLSVSKEERIANGFLIAAAPELYEALETALHGLLWYHDRIPESVDGSDDEAIEQITKALHKASGDV